MIFHLFFVLLILLVFFHILTQYGKVGRAVNKIPGPKALPLIGNILQLLGTTDHMWEFLHEQADKYYPIYKLWVTDNALIFMQHPDDVKALLSCKINIGKPYLYNLLEPWIRECVPMSKGEIWRTRKKLLLPSFHYDIIKNYTAVTIKHGERFVKYLQTFSDETVHSLHLLYARLLLDVTCDAIMGVDLNNIDAQIREEYIHALEEMFSIAMSRLVRPYIRNWMLPFLPLGHRQQRSLKAFHSFSHTIIQERRNYYNRLQNQSNKELENNATQESVSDDNIKGGPKRLATLDLLLSLEKEDLIDSGAVKEEVDGLIIAAHDTTAITMKFLTMLLAENKEIQDRVREEVTKVLDQTEGKVTVNDVQKFEYLEQCIKETLRLFPPAPIIVRYLTKDVQLTNYKLPAGSNVAISIFKVHRDPNVWSNPDKFDPNRFSLNKHAAEHPYAYIPFSAGPRGCMGTKVAIAELKVLAAFLLYNFKLEPVDVTANLRFHAHVTLYTSDPLRVKFIRIHK